MTRLRVLFALTIMVLGIGAGAQDAQLTPLPIFASFIPNVQFAPLYVAIEEGHFAAEGFEAEIQHGVYVLRRRP